MSSSKNIGQIVGLFIGITPPTNTTLIWYDDTPNQRCHKVYNPTTKLWQALNPEIISITTYSELVNVAKKNGLSIGKRYQIRDKNNILATVITPTKLQYVDGIGNIIIDDLGTNAQYHVSSSNIFIDDVNGVLNSSSQLIFSFEDSTPIFQTDYLLGKSRSGNKWKLSKFSLKKLLSEKTGNSLSWVNGLFFNFSDAIKGILDKSGGVVSKNTYDTKVKELEKSIENASKNNQNIVDDTTEAITKATSSDSIYSKKLPINIDTTIVPGDIQRLDTLSTIVSKIQRWILQFKYATGIKLSKGFADAKAAEYINNNDTVESAFGKIQYYLKNPTIVWTLSDDWSDSDYHNAEMVEAGDNLDIIFKKLSGFIRNCMTTIRFDLVKANQKYNSISENKHLYETNGQLGDMLCQLDYNQHHISKNMLNDGIIDYSKVAKKGVFPTDIFRIDVTTNGFNFEGCSFGGVIVESVNKDIFVDDSPEYPDNIYRLTDSYYTYTEKILAFIPVIPVINGKNTGNNYGNASSFIHVEKGVNCQAMFAIKKNIIDSLKASGKNYFKLVFHADVYGYKTTEVIKYVNIREKFIWNINISQSTMQNGNKPHIILFCDITPVANTNS